MKSEDNDDGVSKHATRPRVLSGPQRGSQRDISGSTRGMLAGHQRGTGGALAGDEWGDERGDGCPKLR